MQQFFTHASHCQGGAAADTNAQQLCERMPVLMPCGGALFLSCCMLHVAVLCHSSALSRICSSCVLQLMLHECIATLLRWLDYKMLCGGAACVAASNQDQHY